MSAICIAITNQKGGVGKTTTTANLGIGLARAGKRVLLIDSDPQASLTISLGFQQPDELPITLTQIMHKLMNDEPMEPAEGILHHEEGVDLLPASIKLSGLEVTLVNAMCREHELAGYIEHVKPLYDFIQSRTPCKSAAGPDSDEYKRVRSLVRNNIGYYGMAMDCPNDMERINVFHLDYVMDSMKKVTTPIHNMKAYLLTALFNAPATMDSKQTVDYQRFRAVGVDY